MFEFKLSKDTQEEIEKGLQAFQVDFSRFKERYNEELLKLLNEIESDDVKLKLIDEIDLTFYPNIEVIFDDELNRISEELEDPFRRDFEDTVGALGTFRDELKKAFGK